MSDYQKATKRVDLSPGDSVRILRELQEMSQKDLASVSGIPQSTISAIENDRVRLGDERANMLANALRCHLAVLVFPCWDVEQESAALHSQSKRQHYTQFRRRSIGPRAGRANVEAAESPQPSNQHGFKPRLYHQIGRDLHGIGVVSGNGNGDAVAFSVSI